MHLHFANFVTSNMWALQLQIIFVINSVKGTKKVQRITKKKKKKTRIRRWNSQKSEKQSFSRMISLQDFIHRLQIKNSPTHYQLASSSQYYAVMLLKRVFVIKKSDGLIVSRILLFKLNKPAEKVWNIK